jgi:dihydrofolate reductase
MSTISVFNHVTIDGFYAGPNGEIDWFKDVPSDSAFDAHTHRQSQGASTLLFGRTTYEMMQSFWPTPAAMESDPHIARVMIESPKVVFSRTLKSVEEGPNWKNVTLRRSIERDEILDLKTRGDVTILGSGSIVQQLANLGLIDEYQLMLVPIVLGAGRNLFDGVDTTSMTLESSRSFGNGIVELRYRPA